MVGTIGPVGRGARAQSIWRRMIGAHLAGSVAGGALFGAALGMVAVILRALEWQFGVSQAWANAVVVAVLILCALRDLRVVRFPIPTRHRQVPMAWKYLPGMWSPFVFGFGLGVGVSTTIYLASFYGMTAVALATRDFLSATLVGVGFGAGRVLPILAAVYLSKTEVNDLIGGLAARDRLVARVNGAAIALAAVAIVAAR